MGIRENLLSKYNFGQQGANHSKFVFFTPPILLTTHLQFFMEKNCQKSTP